MTTIDEVPDAFLAEQEQRLAERTFRNYLAVIDLFRRCMNGMANKVDHLAWAEANVELAERLWISDDPAERRWSAVVAYYAILHTAHAVAADLWSDHPEDHFEVRNVSLRMDPNRPALTDEAEAIDRALELLRTVVPELKRMAWGRRSLGSGRQTGAVGTGPLPASPR